MVSKYSLLDLFKHWLVSNLSWFNDQKLQVMENKYHKPDTLQKKTISASSIGIKEWKHNGLSDISAKPMSCITIPTHLPWLPSHHPGERHSIWDISLPESTPKNPQRPQARWRMCTIPHPLPIHCRSLGQSHLGWLTQPFMFLQSKTTNKTVPSRHRAGSPDQLANLPEHGILHLDDDVRRSGLFYTPVLPHPA